MRIFVELAARGGDVRYCDPHVGSVAVGGRIYRSEPWAEEAVADVDCVVILTHHDEFLSKPLWRDADSRGGRHPKRRRIASMPEWSAFDGCDQEHATASPQRRNVARHREHQRRHRPRPHRGSQQAGGPGCGSGARANGGDAADEGGGAGRAGQAGAPPRGQRAVAVGCLRRGIGAAGDDRALRSPNRRGRRGASWSPSK